MALLKFYLLLLFRHTLQSWRQSLLTILGLALGVAVFVSIHLSVGASLRSFKSTVRSISGQTQWQILQDGRELDEGLFPAVKLHPAVEAAAPVVEFQVSLDRRPGEVLWIMGLDFFSEAGIRSHSEAISSIRSEEFFSLLVTPKTVGLNRDFARGQGLKKGDSLTILVHGRPETLTIAALLDPQGTGLALEGNFGVMDIAQAQEVFGKIGRLDRIDLVFKKAGSEKTQLQDLKNILPEGVRIVQPGDRERGTEKMIRSYQLNLTALSFIALLVSMYLIYNTTSLAVARRQKEIGILRALGMMPGQVLWLILLESAGYGLIGGLLGMGGGYFLARLLLDTVSQTITNLYVLVGITRLYFPLWEAASIAFLSVILALASAFLPARQASRIQPREVIYQSPGLTSFRMGRIRLFLLAGIGLLIAAGLLIFVPNYREWPVGGLASTLALTLGFSFLLPPFTRLVIQRVLSLLPRWRRGSVSTRLGLYYAHRYLNRMAIAMAALMTAIAMLISVTVMIRSFRQAVDTWIQQSISGDLFVSPVFPSNRGFSQFLEPWVLRSIEAMEGLSDVYHYRGLITEIRGEPLRLWSGDLAVIQRQGGLAFREGHPEGIFTKVLSGEEILISEVLANQLSLKPGSSLSLITAEGPRRFIVAGVFYDYRTEGGAVWMDRRLFLKYWKDDRVNGLRLYLKDPGGTFEMRQAIQKRFSGQVSLVVVSHRELRDEILKIFDQTFQITYVLEAIALLVAFLGILHTSAISILFREKELGILRALGALPIQIRKMILIETLLMGGFSFLGGGLAGTVLSLILIFVINKQSFGWTIPFYWSWALYLQTLGLILLGSILAGWIPASLAIKGKTQQMIREE